MIFRYFQSLKLRAKAVPYEFYQLLKNLDAQILKIKIKNNIVFDKNHNKKL